MAQENDTTSELQQILTEMVGLQMMSNRAAAHIRADELLVSITKALAMRLDGSAEKLVSAVCQAYDAIQKWYE